jgi:hypothetical protein
VIPAMDHIDTQLTTNAIDTSLNPTIRASMQLAKKTLNRYYSLTDDSEVYRIAMGMYFNLRYTLDVAKISTSPPSSTQTLILQDRWLGAGMDCHGRTTCPRRIQTLIRQHWSFSRGYHTCYCTEQGAYTSFLALELVSYSYPL